MGKPVKREPQEIINRSVYLALVVIAAAAALSAMVTGPFGLVEISVGASVCACLICVALLAHTLRNFGGRKK